MANILSYKQILDNLQSIAERHYMINSFYVGENHDMNTEDLVYPVLQVYPVVARFPQTGGEYKTIEIRLKVKVVDKDLQDNSSQVDVHNDTLRICQDVLNEINQHPFYIHSNATLIGDIEMTQMNEVFDDFLVGWEFDLTLRLKNMNNWCGLPIAEQPGYSAAGPVDSDFSISWGYLTCETITGCTNLTRFIQNYIDAGNSNNTFVQNGLNTFTGGTAIQPTVNVTGGTFSSLTVTGATNLSTLNASGVSNFTGVLQSGGTNLYNIFITAAQATSSGVTVSAGSNINVTQNAFDFKVSTVGSPSFNNLSWSGTANGNALSATTLSGGTFYSGSTPLSTIITRIVTGTSTNINIQNGTNTYTGGTSQVPSINISAATLDNLTVTGNTILSATSASTVSVLNSGITLTVLQDYSGNRIQTGVSYSTIIGGYNNQINKDLKDVNIIGGVALTATTSATTYTSNLVVTGTSMGNLYATRIFSGSTDLSTILGSGVQSVGPGSNITTSGTATNPIISTVASPSFNSITASGASSFASLSATTFISGGTNLYSIFSTTDTITRVAGGTNTYTGGTADIPTVNVSALTINTLVASGASVFTSTLSASTLSASTIISGSTNLYNIFDTKVNSAEFVIAISDETTAITTGTSKVTFYAPYAFTITNAYASLSTSGSTNSAFDIKLTGTTIFSNTSRMVVDLNKFHSSNSTTTPIITGTTVPAFAKISLDILSAGTAAAGAKIYILGTKTL